MVEIKTVQAKYNIRIAALDGVIIPEDTKSVNKWTPIRHGVLLNEYMKWCKNHNGTKQQFAHSIITGINAGFYPILEPNVCDTDAYTAPTVISIMSQIDWWGQSENKVWVTEKDSTEKSFYPNNLMILTSEQKASEARRSIEKEAQVAQMKTFLSTLPPESVEALKTALETK
jgi:hypothetical protein